MTVAHQYSTLKNENYTQYHTQFKQTNKRTQCQGRAEEHTYTIISRISSALAEVCGHRMLLVLFFSSFVVCPPSPRVILSTVAHAQSAAVRKKEQAYRGRALRWRGHWRGGCPTRSEWTTLRTCRCWPTGRRAADFVRSPMWRWSPCSLRPPRPRSLHTFHAQRLRFWLWGSAGGGHFGTKFHTQQKCPLPNG